MLSNLLALAALALPLPAASAAQESQTAQEAPPKPSAEAVLRLDELEVEIEDYFQAWREEQRALQEKAAKEAEAAAAEGRAVSMPAMSMRPDYEPFVDRLLTWAEESAGEDRALYLTKVAQLDGLQDGSRGRAAFERLLREHPKSYAWTRLGGMLAYLEWLVGPEEAARALDTLAASPHGDVRGWVVLARSQGTVETAPRDSEEYAAAKAAILKASEEASDAALKSELQGAIELREKYGVGATAPDIAGVDLDGEAFRLSDYKGKVVFLDFWGDW